MTRLRELLIGPPAPAALAMVMWLTAEIVFSRTIGDEIPIPQVTWLRYGFHLALMCLVLGIPCRFSFVRTSRPWLQLGRSLLIVTMPLGLGLAIERASWDDIVPIFWTAPLLVLIMTSLAGDRPSPLSWIVVLIAVLAVVVMNRPSLRGMAGAALPSFAAAVGFAGYFVLTRVLGRTEPLLTNLFYTGLGAFIALSILLPTFWGPVSARQLVVVVILAILGWITLWLIERSLRQASPARLAPVLFLQPLLDSAIRVTRPSFADLRYLVAVLVVLAVVSAAWWLSPRSSPAPETVV